MIHPFKISLVQAAKRAPPRVLVQDLRFRRYAGDKDHTATWLKRPWFANNLSDPQIKIDAQLFSPFSSKFKGLIRVVFSRFVEIHVYLPHISGHFRMDISNSVGMRHHFIEINYSVNI